MSYHGQPQRRSLDHELAIVIYRRPNYTSLHMPGHFPGLFTSLHWWIIPPQYATVSGRASRTSEEV
jgi:hypothetical protein